MSTLSIRCCLGSLTGAAVTSAAASAVEVLKARPRRADLTRSGLDNLGWVMYMDKVYAIVREDWRVDRVGLVGTPSST